MLYIVVNGAGEYASEGRATVAEAEADLAECQRIRPDLEFFVVEEIDPEPEAVAPWSVEGTITLPDGTVSRFLITEDATMQWGANNERLGRTVDLVEKIADAAWAQATDAS